MSFNDWDAEEVLRRVGYRDLPSGPEVVAPLLEALIHIADARPKTAHEVAVAFGEAQNRAATARSEFVALGGRIP